MRVTSRTSASKKAFSTNARLLAVDVGNTSAAFALFRNSRIVGRFRVRTDLLKSPTLDRFFRSIGPGKVRAAVIASVVPAASSYLKRKLRQKLRCPAWLIGRDIQVPMKNRYRRPGQVGIDRLVNALAAYRQYGKELVIVDFGTAITFDVVSGRGEYLGGVIAPGIEISLDVLYQRTALLPRIRLTHPREIVGKDTRSSIRTGCTYGIGGLCDRILDEIKRSMGSPRPMVIATGGYAGFMSRYCRNVRKIDPDLIMKGIRQTFLLAQK